ncbi:MAG: head-tail connector protein [Bryobacteraceae bacterium]
MYRPILVSAPSAAPVSLAEVKAQCRVDFNDDNVLLNALIDAAVSYADGWTGILGRALCPQTWRQDYDCFRRCLQLPLFPVIEVNSVKYIDPAGVEQTIGRANYTLKVDGLGAYVEFVSTFAFPATSVESASIKVEYDAGYEEGGDEPLPPAIKQGLLLLIGHLYANREAVVVGSSLQVMSVPLATDALFAPYRRIRF